MKLRAWVFLAFAVLAVGLVLAVPSDAQSRTLNDTRTEFFPVVSDTIISAGGDTVVIDRFHDFPVNRSRIYLDVTGDAYLQGGLDFRKTELNVRLSNDTGVTLVDCDFVFTISSSSPDRTEHFHQKCVNPGGPGLEDGETVTLTITTDAVEGNLALQSDESFISVVIVEEQEIGPEMHDFLTDSTIGALTLAQALWGLVWFVAFIWSARLKWFFAAPLAWFGALGAFIQEPIQNTPEQAAWVGVFFLLAVVLHVIGDFMRDRKLETTGD